MPKLLKHVYIANSCLFVDGNLVLQGENPIFVKFLKEVYKSINTKYPKYFKMDPLSKLGFIASEVLLQDIDLTEQAERKGIILGNRASTFIVDCKHQATINDKENYFPSPANFVYTLPNVMTGEICIRNSFKGENAVFVSEKFDSGFVVNYLNGLYKSDKADILIGGFVDADEDRYEAFLFFTKKDHSVEDIKGEEIDKIYQSLKSKAEEYALMRSNIRENN